MADNKDKKVLNVPALRFPEFNNEWSKDILQNVVAFSNGKAHENCVDENGCYILVNSKFVSTEGSVIKKVTLQLSPLFKSQFVMVMSDLPNGKALAKCFYIEEDNIYTLNQRICSFTAQNGNFSRFLMYQINRNKYYLRYDDGINQTNLKKGEVLACPVFIPSIQEQTKIATFIHLLDKRIATQNKIIEKLETLIKGIVVTHHRKYPYKQFVEISKLGKSFSVGVLSKEDLAEDGTPCILYGELFTTYNCVADVIESRTNRTDNQVYSKGDELLFPASTTVDAVSLITPTALIVANVVLGGDMFGIHINKEYNAIYISYILNYVYRQRIAKYAQGCTIIHLHYKDIKNFKLSLPPIEKQEKIVNTLNSMQEKIDCEKQNLRLLNDLRSFLLSKLFI